MPIWVLAFITALAVGAQDTASASISGTIADETSAVVAKSKVLLRGGPVERETETTLDGKFRFEGVPAGEYLLISTMPGFYPSLVSVNLSAGQQVNLGVVQILVVAWGWESPVPFRLLPNLETGNLLIRVAAENGDPLANADVTLICAKAGCGRKKTPQSGEVRFREIESLTSTLEIVADGFYKESLSIRIVNGVELEFHLPLVRCRDVACQLPKFQGGRIE